MNNVAIVIFEKVTAQCLVKRHFKPLWGGSPKFKVHNLTRERIQLEHPYHTVLLILGVETFL